MFAQVGRAVSRRWGLVLIGWILAALAFQFGAPELEQVVTDGEFRFMPEDLPSRRGEELFKRAFSTDILGSSVVIVVRREGRQEGLFAEDWKFIDEVLKPRLEEQVGLRPSTQDSPSGEADSTGGDAAPSENSSAGGDAEESSASIVRRVRTFSDRSIGDLLKSEDGKATLVVVELKTEFLERSNRDTIDAIERLVISNPANRDGLSDLWLEQKIPLGLDLAMTGSGTVGRDMINAADESGRATESATVILVVILLISIYRAPFLALIPLVTVFVAVHIALRFLGLLAQWGVVELFNGIEVYVTVVLYGAGVDYCMFLIARYKEELDAGATYDEAIQMSCERVGSALAASAGTTIAGIGMMAFAQFGKFQQAGVAMSISLIFVLLASLTYTPAILLMFGRWAFWPRMRTERITSTGGWISPTNIVSRFLEERWFSRFWQWVGDVMLKRPATVWLGCLMLMAPFAVVGVMFQDMLSYGLLSELQPEETSRVGAEAAKRHFAAGATGPVTLLLENHDLDFRENEGWQAIEKLTRELNRRADELDIADVRSVAMPLGLREEERLNQLAPLAGALRRKTIRNLGFPHYVSDRGDLAGHVTRIDVVFRHDPFSRYSIEQFDRFRAELPKLLPRELGPLAYDEGTLERGGTRVAMIGPTASIRDLKTVTNADQIRIDVLVVVSVFLVLVILLRRPAICGYLIASVFFSYLATLGVTYAVFWGMDPAGFAGLDWKVPIFLFTILIAVGEDYNIYLITRIEEESRVHGPVRGILVALDKTGSIISSCGIIMAGTFSSLIFGTLVGMNQLGFALAFGVMLDTFVVRPILVPAYLILLHTGRFGFLGRFLGARENAPAAQRIETSLVESSTK